jgi:exonuclease SbcD
MRVLHTSDWHVGRTIRGRSRDDEHRAVLAEIVQLVRDEGVDLVLVAGDIFDHATPSPAAEQIVYETLIELTRDGVHVALIAGNHDNARRFAAVSPFLRLARVHAGADVVRRSEGGCIEIAIRTGETARIALLPWLSQRGIVRAEQLMGLQQAAQQERYQKAVRQVLDELCGGFGNDAVNLVLAHTTIAGAPLGGGERAAETIFEYFVPATFLPANAHYIALGHIHRQQRVITGAPAWYSGSPLQLDFGEAPEIQGVLLFEATPRIPIADVRPIRLSGGRPLITVRGTLDQVLAGAAAIDPRAHVRVQLDEPPRPGLAEAVYQAIPGAVRVDLIAQDPLPPTDADSRMARSPRELYAAFLEEERVNDPGPLLDLFDELLAEATDAARSS